MYERYISQLAHVKVVTPKIEASLAFYKTILGLEESGREGGSVFLRGWGEHFFHSLELVEGKAPALAHIGWRAQGPGQLEQAAKRIEAAGAGIGWSAGNQGHGKAYRYRPTLTREEHSARLMLEALSGGGRSEAVLNHFVAQIDAEESASLRNALRRLSGKTGRR